ncbi:hypothetical protein LTR27_009870 [Elasticomyces elasticus]|nr:hypothetical protein LTR27_009870 [Elasticomyces elasticus]
MEIRDVGGTVSTIIELVAESLRVLGFTLPIWPIVAIEILQPLNRLQLFDGHMTMLPVLSRTDAVIPHSSVQLDAVFPPTVESLTLWQAQDLLRPPNAFLAFSWQTATACLV